MNSDEWAGIAETLRLAWPNAFSEEREAFYRQQLGDLPAHQVREAVQRLVREDREEIPPPGVIRAASERRAGSRVPLLSSMRGVYVASVAALIAVMLGGFWTYWEGRYPDYPPDLDCAEIGHQVRVGAEDPHGLDADDDGVGCEVERPTWAGLALVGYLGGAGLGVLGFVSYRRIDSR